jgi:uncharacterized protein (TIGR03437 family)
VLKSAAFFLGFAATCLALTSPPRTVYASYLGGSYGEGVIGLAVDSSGSAYVVGSTNSPDFPLTSIVLGAPAATTTCAFVTKFNSAGTGIVFSVCIGNTRAQAFGLDANGNMYLAIQHQDQPSSSVLKLDPTGQKVLFETPIGVVPEGMAVDAAGDVYLSGSASSGLPATPGAYQRQPAPGICHGGAGVGMSLFTCSDAFVMKLRPTGEVAWATYLGGSGPDEAHAIAIDSTGSPWVVGETVSKDFPITPGAFQSAFHGEVDLGPLSYGDAFVAKLDPTGGKLLYSSYLGGDAPDGAFAVAVDAADSAYFTGGTQSLNFPTTPAALQTTYTGPSGQIPSLQGNAFVVKFNSSGKALYATFLGGSNTRGSAIAVDSMGQATVNAGGTELACAGPAAVTVLNPAGSAMAASSPVSADYLALDGKGALYSAGLTRKLVFLSTPHAFQTQYAGGDSDAYAAKVDFTQPAGITLSSVVNAASLLSGNTAGVPSGAVAPGEIVTLFGSGFATPALVDFSGLPATVLYASNCQINAVVPLGVLSEVSTFLTVFSGWQSFGPVKLPVAAAQLGLFTIDGTGRGQAAINNQDGSVNSASNPAPRGSIVAVYLTGAGSLLNGPQPGLPIPPSFASISATIGSATADIVFAGQAPSLVTGVTQVYVRVPQNAPVGPAVPITIFSAVSSSQFNPPVFIAVQ